MNLSTRDFVLQKYNLKTDLIEIPNVSREDLADLLHELDFKIGVEVGVAAGAYSLTLAKANPQMKLYGVDPYLPYKGYKDYQRPETFSRLMDEAQSRLDAFPQYEFIREFSLDAVKRFEDNSLDFVYIDANHQEEFVTQDITAWIEKLKPGGIMAGDDYARVRGHNGEPSTNWAVIPAVNKYVKAHDMQLYLWGLEAKIPGIKRDPIRTWMVIK